MGFCEDLKNNLLFFDGALGTVLLGECLKPGENPTVLNKTNPEPIQSIHRCYLESGADIVTTNTFSNSRFKVEGLPCSVAEYGQAAVTLARQAIQESGKQAYIAYDIGPCGKLLEPMGELSFDQAYDIFKEQVLIAKEAGADLILLETMADLYEIKAGILAAKENSNLPVVCTMTIEQTGRSYTGSCVESLAILAEDLGASAVGLNCSVGPRDLLPYAIRLTEISHLPVIVQPNAGLPKEHNGVTTFDISAQEFADTMLELARHGVSILGGCCGTNYEYIRKMKETVGNLPPVHRETESSDYASTASSYVEWKNAFCYSLITEENASNISAMIHSADWESIIDIAMDEFDYDAQVMELDLTKLTDCPAASASELVKQLQTMIRVPFLFTIPEGYDTAVLTRYYNGKAAIRIQ